MKPEESAKLLAWWEKHREVVKAHAMGATIQYKSVLSEGWVNVTNNSPTWNKSDEYRIKPEPRTIKVIEVWLDGKWKHYWDSASHCNYENAISNAKKYYSNSRVSEYVEKV